MGFAVFAFTLSLNYVHASKDYGMLENESSVELLTLYCTTGNGDDNEDDYKCTSGGQGSLSCSTSVTVNGSGTACEVQCESGYYACCNAFHNKCQCRGY